MKIIIDLDKREEWETHIHTEDNDMLAIWIGHVKGSFYGNFSYRKNGKIYQKKRGFHLRQEMFEFYLCLPLDWVKIIDCYVNFSKNDVNVGIDLKTGEFVEEVKEVYELSK